MTATAPEPGSVGYLAGRAAMQRARTRSSLFAEREFLTELSDWLGGDRVILAVDVRAFIAGGTDALSDLYPAPSSP